MYGDGAVTVTNTTLLDNKAVSGLSSGGGIYGGGAVTVTNSTISGNTAPSAISEHGGGIYGAGIFVNNIFKSNSSEIYFIGDSYVYNKNDIDDTKLQNDSVYLLIKKNNIQPSAGSPNFIDASFRIYQGLSQ